MHPSGSGKTEGFAARIDAAPMAESRQNGPILLIGGTRGTGLLIARLLAQRGFPIRVLARHPTDARQRVPPLAEIVHGDITQPPTLPAAVSGARHIVFTAGCRSGRPVSQRRVRQTEYEGVSNTLTAANRAGFAGRFLYMTSSGVASRSFWTRALNVYKGNTLEWRAQAETLIRASGLAYTIIRTGMLTNGAGGKHGIRVTQEPLPLSPRYRIARMDVASVFVAAMEHPRTSRVTLEIVQQQRGGEPWLECFDRLAENSL